MVTRKRSRSKRILTPSRCKGDDGALQKMTAVTLLQQRGTNITKTTDGRYYGAQPCFRDWKTCLRARTKLRRILELAVLIVWVPRVTLVGSMRIPRPWSEESACEMALDPDWPFVYSKYREQEVLPQHRQLSIYRTVERQYCFCLHTSWVPELKDIPTD